MSGAPQRTVLVVDDEPGPRRLIAETLRLAGFDAVEAEGGDHALRLLANHEYDAVVLDRVMAGLDGIEVLQWIRRTPSIALTPVLLVTGRDDVADVVAGLAGGADDYITKPFDPDELVARVEAKVRGREGWAALVEREVERRTALTDAARSAGHAGPIDQAAMQLCEALVRLPGTSGACVLEVAGETVVPLAAKGTDPFQQLATTPRSEPLGRRLVRRAQQGAWLEPVVEQSTADSSAVAVAPVLVADEIVGLVLAAADPPAGRAALDQLLAVTIDFAALGSGLFGSSLRLTADRDRDRQHFVDLVERRSFSVVFQPVVDLDDRSVVGYEALSRFDTDDPVEQVFAGAARAGLGPTVELRTLEAAIAASVDLPAGAWLSLNVSPSLLLAGADLADRLRHLSRPAVLEVSELEPVLDYGDLRVAIDELGSRVQLSIDDAGSGFAGLRHILALGADFVKVDRTWIAGIDDDPARRALVAGLQNFADETGAVVIAEGIETPAELEAVRRLGIRLGQGYLLGRAEEAR